MFIAHNAESYALRRSAMWSLTTPEYMALLTERTITKVTSYKHRAPLEHLVDFNARLKWIR